MQDKDVTGQRYLKRRKMIMANATEKQLRLKMPDKRLRFKMSVSSGSVTDCGIFNLRGKRVRNHQNGK